MSDDDRKTEVLRDIRCACGAKVVDAVGEREVVVDGERIPFRRTTDFIVCPSCGSLYRVTDVGNGLVTNAPTGTASDEDEDG